MEWTNYVAEKKKEGILFYAEIRVVGSYTDRLLRAAKFYLTKNARVKVQAKSQVTLLCISLKPT